MKQRDESYEFDRFEVRAMRRGDLDRVVEIDEASGGRRRPRYFETLIERSLGTSSLQVSLAAEADGRVVGFLIASLYYGEFGVAEPSASIDGIGVHPQYRRTGVGRALLRQLRRNLGALQIERLRTEVAWDDFDLLAFFKSQGFDPARRLCLERAIDPTVPDDQPPER